MAGSWGLMTSRMATMDETETVPSFVDSRAMWVWQSIKPGVTCLPLRSMILAPMGARTFSPTSLMSPSRMMMEPVMVPWVTVWMVAFCRTIVEGEAGGAAGWARMRPQAAAAIKMVRRGFITAPSAGGGTG